MDTVLINLYLLLGAIVGIYFIYLVLSGARPSYLYERYGHTRSGRLFIICVFATLCMVLMAVSLLGWPLVLIGLGLERYEEKKFQRKKS